MISRLSCHTCQHVPAESPAAQMQDSVQLEVCLLDSIAVALSESSASDHHLLSSWSQKQMSHHTQHPSKSASTSFAASYRLLCVPLVATSSTARKLFTNSLCLGSASHVHSMLDAKHSLEIAVEKTRDLSCFPAAAASRRGWYTQGTRSVPLGSSRPRLHSSLSHVLAFRLQ